MLLQYMYLKIKVIDDIAKNINFKKIVTLQQVPTEEKSIIIEASETHKDILVIEKFYFRHVGFSCLTVTWNFFPERLD